MRKRILVTGSSRGIGKAIALRLASDGFDITVHCRSNYDDARDTATQIEAMDQQVDILQFDTADRTATTAAIGDAIDTHGSYYGVVCNAGIHRDKPFPAIEGDDWDDVLRTNLDGFYNVLHPIVMPMIRAKQGGRIVTLSSVSGLIGNQGQVNYSAAKAGIIGASKALAVELAKRKITVNCIAPGLIETDMVKDMPLEEAARMIPMRRIGTASEVAGTASFLCSDDASYITRQVISVNGGLA